MRLGYFKGALALWLLPLLVVSVMVATRPLKRTVTPTYHEASRHWSQRETLYEGTTGMHYLPPFVALYAPFEWLPLRVSEVVWRWLNVGLIVAGLGGICRRAFDTEESTHRAFFFSSMVALPLSLPAIRNGQANATLAGLFLVTAACLMTGRKWGAALALGLAVAVKPLGIAAIGLAVAVYPSLLLPSVAAVVGVLLLPYVTAPMGYVAGQYQAAWVNLRECAVISEDRFADLNGILRACGTELNGNPGLMVRALAGLTFFVLCATIIRRWREPDRGVAWLGLSCLYLMLFNPMTEANSYVILAPVMGLAALLAWQRAHTTTAYFWGGVALSMGLLPNLVRPWLGNSFALVWHPSMAILFLVWTTLVILRSRSIFARPPDSGPTMDPPAAALTAGKSENR